MTDKVPPALKWLGDKGLPDGPEKRNKGTEVAVPTPYILAPLSALPSGAPNRILSPGLNKPVQHALHTEYGRCIGEFAAN